jgi:hypothetical protein
MFLRNVLLAIGAVFAVAGAAPVVVGSAVLREACANE